MRVAFGQRHCHRLLVAAIYQAKPLHKHQRVLHTGLGERLHAGMRGPLVMHCDSRNQLRFGLTQHQCVDIPQYRHQALCLVNGHHPCENGPTHLAAHPCQCLRRQAGIDHHRLGIDYHRFPLFQEFRRDALADLHIIEGDDLLPIGIDHRKVARCGRIRKLPAVGDVDAVGEGVAACMLAILVVAVYGDQVVAHAKMPQVEGDVAGDAADR